MTYQGEQILSDDDFLKRLPLSLDAAQRLTMEGLAHIADALAASYRVLYDLAHSWAATEDTILSSFDRARMFNSAWSIVDDIHAARQLFQRLVKKESAIGGFRHSTQDFKRLRDKMDHLSDNVGNLVAAKGVRRPIFGALSFLYIGPEHLSSKDGVKRAEGGRSYMVTAGTVSGREVVQVVTPAGQSLVAPIEDVTLGAFDIDVRLGAAIELFSRAIKSLSAETEVSCREALQRQFQTVEEVERALAQMAPYGLALVANFEFVDVPAADAD